MPRVVVVAVLVALSACRTGTGDRGSGQQLRLQQARNTERRADWPPASKEQDADDRRFAFGEARTRREADAARRARERHEAGLRNLQVLGAEAGECAGLTDGERRTCPLDAAPGVAAVEDIAGGVRLRYASGADAQKVRRLLACHNAIARTADPSSACPLHLEAARTVVREESGQVVLDIVGPHPGDAEPLRQRVRGFLGR